MNQSELEASICNGTKREKTRGLSFTFDWSRKWREIFLANHRAKLSKTKAKRELLSTLN